jgi:DMSO/TMAO reductase YedYZ heme-binding membrane subunit
LGHALIDARQLFGLWALGFLLASILIGPLTSVLPWIPWKSSLMYGRRAVGLSALVFALLHSMCYLWSVFHRNWREFYTPGILWIAGLLLGVVAMTDMVALSVTSRDKAVKQMGGRRWKRLHRTVYFALGVVLLHSLFVGADFGINRGPDVSGAPDAGSGITFLCVSAGWLVLFILRHRGVRWAPRVRRSPPAGSLQ